MGEAGTRAGCLSIKRLPHAHRAVGGLGQAQRNDRRRQEQETRVEQRGAEIAHLREQPEEHRAERGGDAPDVVAEPGARRAQQRREQRRQDTS